MSHRLLLISPVRNEEAHLELVAEAMAAQTRPPDRGSSSTTAPPTPPPRSSRGWPSGSSFLQVVDAAADPGPARPAPKGPARDGRGTEGFNRGLDSLDWRSFTHIAKLDGDTELPPHYFELLLERFAATASWGWPEGCMPTGPEGRREVISGCPLRPPRAGRTEVLLAAPASKRSAECTSGSDGTRSTRSTRACADSHARLPRSVADHHRPWGSADGHLRGRARHGRCAYIVHYPLPWVAAAGGQDARACGPGGCPGWPTSAATWAPPRASPRVDDPEFRALLPARAA